MKRIIFCVILAALCIGFVCLARSDDQTRITQLQGEYQRLVAVEIELQERLTLVKREKEIMRGRIIERDLVKQEREREEAKVEKKGK